MGRVHIQKIERWYGGVSDDVREQSGNQFASSEHFDIFTNPTRLTPFRSTELDNTISGTSSDMTTFQARGFLYYNSTSASSTDNAFYAYGRVSSNLDSPRLLVKTAASYPTGSWALAATSTATSGSRVAPCFVVYKDYIYGMKGSNTIWRYGSLRGTKSMNNAWATTTASFGFVAQPIVGKDDELYFFHDNIISKVNSAGAFINSRLVLPSDCVITDSCQWQNYLAIATRPRGTGQVSRVFLWDYISDDVTEVIDWGQGDLYVLGNIEGQIVGVSQRVEVTASTNAVVIRAYTGGTAKIIKEISGGTALKQYKAVVDDKLFFAMSDGTTQGIWCFGRKNQNYPFATTLAYLINNNTAETFLWAFTLINDFLWVSTDDTYNIRRTNEDLTSAGFASTSSVVSQKYNLSAFHKRKELEIVSLAYPALTTGQAITVYYRVDGNSSWVKIFEDTAVGSMFHEAVNEEANAKNFDAFNEIQFKISSRGGASPAEFKFRAREDDSQFDNNENAE